MKKYPFISFFAIAFLSLSVVTYAQPIKVIKLKDGSILQGKVLELKENVYTLETSNLGTVNIPESDVLSISSPELLNPSLDPASDAKKVELKQKVDQLQGTILADPGLMEEIQNLVNNEEIKAMLSDPKLLNDAMSFDPDKIQQNKNVQDLMKNPQIQNLMNKIQQKIPAQQ